MTDTTAVERGVYRWVDQIFSRSMSGADGAQAGVSIERFQQDDGSALPGLISIGVGIDEMTGAQARELAAILSDAADTYERAQRGERVPSTGETVPST
jgi:hypothetical protein